jgi:tRNA threonylcarbamoyladenosine biosynthesis protein TsaE
MKKYNVLNLPSMKQTARDILLSFYELENSPTATLVSLSGDLGSGKTTFTQYIGKSLGIMEKINSPTFVISKKYTIPKTSIFSKKWKHLIHIDAYRLEGSNESENIGLSEQLNNSENIIFIEWPEMIQKSLPKDSIWLNFKYISEDAREITII